MASKTPRGDREKKKYSVRGELLGQARRDALTYLLVSSYLAPRIKCSHRILTHRSLAPVHCRGTMVLLYAGLGLGGTSCTSCMFVNVNCAMAPLPFLEDPPVLALSQCVSQARFCTRSHDTPRGRVIGATPSTCGLNYISLLSLSEEDGDTLTSCMWDRSCIGAGKAVNLGMVTLSRIGWVCVYSHSHRGSVAYRPACVRLSTFDTLNCAYYAADRYLIEPGNPNRPALTRTEHDSS